MPTISIEAKPTDIPGLGHLYLVYKDEVGQEFVVGARPESIIPPHGLMLVEAHVRMDQSEDNRVDDDGNPLTPADRGSRVIDLNGRDALAVWDLIVQQANNIEREGIGYDSIGGLQTSNSFIASVLNVVGIDVAEILPSIPDVSLYPGHGNPIDFDYNLTGTVADDGIRGYEGNDNIIGSSGDDLIDAGEGNDTIDYSRLGEGVSIYIYADDGTTPPNVPFSPSGNFSARVDKAGLDFDLLYNVEKIIGTTQKDTIVLIDFIQKGTSLRIDGGGGQSGQLGDDIIDGSGLAKGMDLRLFGNGAGFIRAKDGSSGTLILENFNTTIKGTSFDDIIIDRSNGPQDIDAGAGNDVVEAAGANSVVVTGAGNDVIIRAGVGSVITTGTGEDTVGWSPGVLVTDADGHDRVSFFGLTVGTALKWGASESPWAYGAFGLVKVGFNSAGEMVIGTPFYSAPGSAPGGDAASYMYLANGNNDPFAAPADLTAGIRVAGLEFDAYQLIHLPDNVKLSDNDGIWEFMALTVKEFFSDARVAGSDPLVLDLDGDGLELTAESAVAPMFDVDGDMFAEPTGWVGADDGLLAIDLNGNGTIDDVSELFGSADQSGFAALAAYDSNTDGVIDVNDTLFGSLRIWQDLNQNGVTDAGELKTLAEHDIVSIGLTATDDGSTNALNTVLRTGTFTRGDATTGTVGDIEFRVDNFNTHFTGDTTVDPTVAATMPNLKGHGTLADLHVTLTLETGGLLAAAINTALPTLNVVDLAALRANAMPIFEAWANALPGQTAFGNPDVPILVEDTGTDEVVRDFAVEVTEDIDNGDGSFTTVTYWKLASGGAVTDAMGDPIIYPTSADVLAQIDADPNKDWRTLSGSELDFLERYIGEDIPIEDVRALNAGAVTGLSSLLTKSVEILDALALRLASQGPLAPYFAGLEYDVAEDGFRPTTDRQLIPMFEAIFTAAPADTPGVTDWLTDWEPLIDSVLGDYSRGAGHLLNSFNFIFANIVAAHEIIGPNIGIVEAAGALGIPTELLVTGAGTIDGTAENDIFYMDGTDQTARGGEGYDVYVFGRDFGTDVIDDTEAYGTNRQPDLLRFADYASTDVTMTRNGMDLIITVTGTAHTITVKRQFEGRQPDLFGSDLSDDTGVAEIAFADGVVFDKVDIARAAAEPRATSDTYMGTNDIDFLDGGAGNDFLQGGNDTDIYMFGIGYGNDSIEEGKDNLLLDGEDYVQFGAGITEDDLVFSRNGDSVDLQIAIAGTTDTLTVQRQFVAYDTGIFDLHWFDRIETFLFSDGSALYWTDVLEKIVREGKTDGADAIYGFHYQDTLDGGAGDDFLSGGDDGDTYVFGKAYGADVIEDRMDNIMTQTADKVAFAADVAAADVVYSRTGNSDDLVISFLDDASTLTVQGQFAAAYTGTFGTQWFNRIESFDFVDGTSLSWDALMAQMLAEAKTAGDDVIYGFDHTDTLDGGAGNDLLIGGNDNDIYIFGRGYGNDTIDEQRDRVLSGDFDIVQFTPDILPADIVLERGVDPEDLLIRITDTADTLLVKGMFRWSDLAQDADDIEEFHFDNGTIWTQAQVRDMLLAAESTAGDDLIQGFTTDDTLDGGTGNDRLEGKSGSDAYVYEIGDGDDVIHDYGDVTDVDRLIFGAGLLSSDAVLVRPIADLTDLTISFSGTAGSVYLEDQFSFGWFGLEEFEFGDGVIWTEAQLQQTYLQRAVTAGNDTIHGFAGDDTLTGGAGNDSLHGAEGSDTYTYNTGDGDDTVFDEGDSGDVDRLVFGSGLLAADAVLARSGTNLADLTISFTGTMGSVMLEEQFGLNWHGVEEIEFGGGTIWTEAQLQQAYLQQVSTSGDDTIDGFAGADTLAGGAGNDTLRGREGSDTYTYNTGEGDDTVFDEGDSGDVDRLVFGSGLLAADAVLARSGTSLSDLTISFTGTMGSVLLEEQFGLNWHGLEEIEFGDGVVWDEAQLQQAYLQQVSTIGNDTIDGFAGADTLAGGAGNDTLCGREGSDTYTYNTGDGDDTIFDEGDIGDIDRLVFGAGLLSTDATLSRSIADLDDLTIGFAGTVGSVLLDQQFGFTWHGLEEIEFGDGVIWNETQMTQEYLARAGTAGNDSVFGFDTADTIAGGAGDDYLDGGEGGDAYAFNSGDGHDVIEDSGASTDLDIIDLGAGIAVADVTVAKAGTGQTELLITIAGGNSITVNGQFGGANPVIEELHFNDGTIWTAAYIDELTSYTLIPTHVGTSGNETLTGDNGDNILEALGGNDTVNGKDGSDIYLFSAGDGQDVVEDNGWLDTDQLVIRGYTPGQVSVASAANPINFVLSFSGSSDQITVKNSLEENGFDHIEEIVFDDATVWTMAYLRDRILTEASTGGNDTITGFKFDETFVGGAGNDTIYGKDGSDTYVFSAGDGQDVIDDNGWLDTDKLVIHGYTPGQVSVGRGVGSGAADLVLSFSGSSDQITIKRTLEEDGYDHIEQIVFDDATIWTMPALRDRLLTEAATSGDDTITGFKTADTLDGGVGNDTLHGMDGSDIYDFSAGDGQDVIEENGWLDTDQLLIHGYTPGQVTAARGAAATDLLLTFDGSTDQITLINTLEENAYDHVEQIVFDDATVWTMADARAKVLSDAATAGNDTIVGFNGTDVLNGGAGNDTLTGGNGADVFAFETGWGDDTITDFALGTDIVDLSTLGIAFGDLAITYNAGDANVAYGGNNIAMLGIASGLDSNDFTFT